MFLKWCRIWVAIAVGAVATGFVHSATIHYDDEFIVGVSNIVSRGITYNIAFKDGSCASLFSGCDSLNDFPFLDESQAADASFALHTVLTGQEVTQVRGCGNGYPCTTYTPFYTPYRYFSTREGWVDARFFFVDRVSPSLSSGGLKDLVAEYDTSPFSNETFMIFTPVPEPFAWILFPAGFLLVRLARRTRHSECLANGHGSKL